MKKFLKLRRKCDRRANHDRTRTFRFEEIEDRVLLAGVGDDLRTNDVSAIESAIVSSAVAGDGAETSGSRTFSLADRLLTFRAEDDTGSGLSANGGDLGEAYFLRLGNFLSIRSIGNDTTRYTFSLATASATDGVDWSKTPDSAQVYATTESVVIFEDLKLLGVVLGDSVTLFSGLAANLPLQLGRDAENGFGGPQDPLPTSESAPNIDHPGGNSTTQPISESPIHGISLPPPAPSFGPPQGIQQPSAIVMGVIPTSASADDSYTLAGGRFLDSQNVGDPVRPALLNSAIRPASRQIRAYELSVATSANSPIVATAADAHFHEHGVSDSPHFEPEPVVRRSNTSEFGGGEFGNAFAIDDSTFTATQVTYGQETVAPLAPVPDRIVSDPSNTPLGLFAFLDAPKALDWTSLSTSMGFVTATCAGMIGFFRQRNKSKKHKAAAIIRRRCANSRNASHPDRSTRLHGVSGP